MKDKQRDEVERIAKVLALGRIACPRCETPYQRAGFHRPYFICASCGQRWSEDPIINALGTWLSELNKCYPFEWFATLTFAGKRLDRALTVKPKNYSWLSEQGEADITPNGAAYWFNRYLEDASAAGIAKPYAFRADEYGPLFGRYHIHALVGNVGHLQIYCGARLQKNTWGNRCCWVHRWPCGYARIFPYDSQLGATYYLSKYVVKRLANWDLVGFESENLVFNAEPPKRAVVR